jgi:presenilin-like A22 family membrane protease
MENYLKNGIIFVILFLSIITFALWLSWPVDITPGVTPGTTQIDNFREFQNPQDTGNTAFMVGGLLLMTGLILAGFKFGFGRFVKVFFIFIIFISLMITFGAILSRTGQIGVNEMLENALFILAIVLTGIVIYRPFGLITNVVGFFIAGGISAIMGISFGILPALALLIIFAIYDAIAVYKTKHMVFLAQNIIDSRTPISLFTSGEVKAGTDLSKRKEQESTGFMIGLGDFAIPAILVVSANVFLRDSLVFGLSIPAIGAIIGAIAGYIVLSYMSHHWKQAHAGLPPLNTTLIAGFLIACTIVGEFGWLPF